jgi:hypothetical protein
MPFHNSSDNTKTSSMTDAELVFKGMRRFRYRNEGELVADAFRSPYRWWWSYLRLSKDYWWACERNGFADDPRLRNMYSDFGKVYEMTFEQWWRRRGAYLFSEQVALPAVRQMDARNLQLSRERERHLLLEIPLNLTERTIISQVRKILREHPERAVDRLSSAQRKLAKFTGIRQDAIETAHAVWRLHYESRDGRAVGKIGQPHGSKSLYQIGRELRLVRSCMPQVTDNPQRAAQRVNGMKVAVSRMLTRANQLIEHAALGVFPAMRPVSEPVFWRPFQSRRLAEAVAAGYWQPLFEPEHLLNVQQPDHADGHLVQRPVAGP